MNKFDKLYIVFILTLSLALFMMSKLFVGVVNVEDAYAVVFYYDKEITRYKMSNEGFHTVKGDLGDVVIEIKDGRIRVADEISPKNYCQIQGWVEYTNTPIICLPNGIKIQLENNKHTEEDIIVR